MPKHDEQLETMHCDEIIRRFHVAIWYILEVCISVYTYTYTYTYCGPYSSSYVLSFAPMCVLYSQALGPSGSDETVRYTLSHNKRKPQSQ